MNDTLAQRAVAVLQTADARDKAAAARTLAADWTTGRLAEIGRAAPPDRPARPARPELRQPRDMPRRGKAGSAQTTTSQLPSSIAAAARQIMPTAVAPPHAVPHTPRPMCCACDVCPACC